MNVIKLNIIHDEEDHECAGIFINATIDLNEYRFLLDTGAAISSIQDNESTSQYPIMNSHETGGTFSRKTQNSIIIPSFKLGSLIKTNVEFYRVVGEAERVNLIGMNILKDFELHFDFKSNILEVSNDSARFTKSGNEIIMGAKDHPYISVAFEEKSVLAIWDSGASITVVDNEFIRHHPNHFKLIGNSTGTDSGGETQQTPLYEMMGIIIDGHLFPTHHVAGVDLSFINSRTELKMSMILGYSTFSHADWRFNFPDKKWRIEKFRPGAC